MHLKDADCLAKSVDPDQTAPLDLICPKTLAHYGKNFYVTVNTKITVI